MNWHFSFFLVAAVTLPSVCSQFNPLSLEELGSNTGIQVFNQIVRSRPHDNVVVSPHGIASVLGMLQLGADGRTKKQLTTVMRYGVNGACPLSSGWWGGEGACTWWGSGVPTWQLGSPPRDPVTLLEACVPSPRDFSHLISPPSPGYSSLKRKLPTCPTYLVRHGCECPLRAREPGELGRWLGVAREDSMGSLVGMAPSRVLTVLVTS